MDEQMIVLVKNEDGERDVLMKVRSRDSRRMPENEMNVKQMRIN
jgi:hypothetical protein